VGVTVVAVSDNATKVTINPQNKQAQLFARAGADITKKFLAAVEEKLKVTAP
jgi:virulence-associated protein VagC